MSKAKGKPRRVRVPGEANRNIYERYDGKFEIGYRDETGKQRWHGPIDTMTRARRIRDDLLGRKSRGETTVPSDPSLKYGAAWAAYRADEVADLDENTQGTYDGHYNTHLTKWANRRLDSFKKNDAAQLVRDLRAAGLSEWSIVGIIGVASRVFRYARQNLEWTGTNPFDLLDSRQRPKVSKTPPRRIYEGDELDQVIAATTEPWRTLFRLADVCAGRESELLGLWQKEINIADLDASTIDFKAQVSRKGVRKPLKTDESLATDYPIPRAAAVMLKAHLDRNPHKGPKAFVFATASGRAISQRNALRALYRAQERARKPDGTPTFPELFEDPQGNLMVNGRGEYIRNDVPRKVLRLPHFHGIRHSAAMDCDDLEESRDVLRHKDSTVTAKVYRLHMTAKRRSALRDRMEARERRRGGLEARLEATDHDGAQQGAARSAENPGSEAA